MEAKVEALVQDVAGLKTRVTALEEFVHEEMKPKLDRNTEMTAAIDARTDEMYEAFVMAKNGVKVLTKAGNGIMWAADKAGRLAKPAFWLVLTSVIAWSFYTTGKVPDWVVRLLS